MFTKADIEEILERDKNKILKIHYGHQERQIAYITHDSNVGDGIVETGGNKIVIINKIELKDKYLYAKYSYIYNDDKKKITYGEYVPYSDIRYIYEVY